MQPSEAASIDKISLVQLAKATRIFLRTPIRTILRALPPLPDEFGGKRKVFDLNVFIFESWLSASGKKSFLAEGYSAMEAFSKYVTRIDDMLDSSGHPQIGNWNRSYKKDRMARKAISIFVGKVSEMRENGIITKEQAEKIFKDASDYRKVCRSALMHFESMENPSISEILRVKEETTGNLGSVMVRITSTIEKMPVERERQLAGAFSNSFMATQVADDMLDVADDLKQRVPNIAVAVLKNYPDEFASISGTGSPSINSYKRFAPKSYVEMMKIAQHYVSLIPDEPESMQVLKAIPKLFFKAAQLTSRGK